MYYVYAIRSLVREYIYIGHTQTLDKRIHEHNSGKTKSNKFARPFVLIYSKQYATREEAIKMERELKKSHNREKLRKINTESLP